MPNYVLLMNLTDQGISHIKDAPTRIQQAAQALEEAGGKVLGFYAVMGPYDYVAIVEAPSDEIGLAQLLVLGMGGNVRTTTLKAFPLETFAQIVKQLP